MLQGEGVQPSEASEGVVRSELDHLIESATFRNSKRCREFLKYIVERTIDGRTEALRERSIGVDLFQLPPNFDTGQHTIVRVTANEVRKKLAQHYLAENGTHHAVRIELPPGSYSADFKWSPTAEAAHVDTAPVDTQALAPTRRPGWAVVATILAAVVVVGGSVLFWRSTSTKVASDNAGAVHTAAAFGTAPGDAAGIRMIAGSANPYLDRSGRSWMPDRFFTGGSVFARPSERVLRTLDPDIYRHLRQGEFRYDIPLQAGSYELRLHFAETGLADSISAESSGEGQRLFRVSANGKQILDLFDVVADAAGANISDERVFRDIAPADDGLLHLAFVPMRGSAMLSGIEILPMSGGKVRPFRIRAGWTASWHDSAGQLWQADSYFQGGNALVRTTNPAQASNAITPDMALYASERWGHFSYAVPAAEGRYRVTLKFCEGHYGKRNTGVGGVGSRLFDVYCNGVALLRDFDILKEAGGEGVPIDRSFAGIRPTAQGKILLTFVPVKGMACVNGIEVVDESK